MNARRSMCAPKDQASSRTPRNSSPIIESLESRVLLNADWTILVYMAGDNSLESAMIADINEMEVIGSTNNVNIIVQCDFSSETALPGDFGSDNTVRSRITQDTDTENYSSMPVIGPLAANPILDSVPEYADYSWGIKEANMGDYRELVSFITWGMYRYAADHYAVILWDHGGGVEGVCWDDTDNNDYLQLNELDQAFYDVYDLMGAEAEKIDLIGFDACLMGMTEVAYEMSDYANVFTSNDTLVMVGAEALEPNQGWDYTAFLRTLTNNTAMSAGQLGSRIVTTYQQYYENYVETLAEAGNPYDDVINLSAIDLTRIQSNNGFATYLDAFITETITTATETDFLRLHSIRNKTYPYDGTDGNFRDLGVFLSAVANDTFIQDNICEAAKNALDAYNRLIIANANVNGSALMNGTGLSIYLPDPEIGAGSMYLNSGIDFVDGTQWGMFLDWWDNREAAGTVKGTVFDDTNTDGVQNGAEGLLDDFCYVYLDINKNGTYDYFGTKAFPNTRTKKIVGAMTTSAIEVSGMNQFGVILDVNVTIDTTKTDLRYHTFTLVSPDGEKRIVLSRQLSSTSSFDETTFDDEAPEAITSSRAEAPYSDSFKPIGNLGYLDGLMPDGEWTLEITDSRGLGGGTLWGWSLELEIGDPVAPWYSGSEEYTIRVVEPEIDDPETIVDESLYTVGVVDDPYPVYPHTGIWGTTSPNPSVSVTINHAADVDSLGEPLALGAISGGAVEGYVYNDVDNDGSFDNDENGLPDFIVFADKAGGTDGFLDDGEIYTYTDSDGYYFLAGLIPGVDTYTICSISNGAYHLTDPDPLDPSPYTFTIESGDWYTNVNFGYEGPYIYGVSGETAVAEDSSGTFTLEGEDQDHPADPITFTVVNNPQFGTLTWDANGDCEYTPDADFNGHDYFGFTCTNTVTGDTSDLTIYTIHVTAVNDAPEIVSDILDITEVVEGMNSVKYQINEVVVVEGEEEKEETKVLDLFNYFYDLEADALYGANGSKHLTFVPVEGHEPKHGTFTTFKNNTGETICQYTNNDRYSENPEHAYDDPNYGTFWDVFWVYVWDEGDPLGAIVDAAGAPKSNIDGFVDADNYIQVIIYINEQNDAPDCPDQYLTIPYEGDPLDFTLVGTDEETSIGELTFGMLSNPVFVSVDPSSLTYLNATPDQKAAMEYGTAGRVDLDGNQATLYFAQNLIWETQYVKFTYQVTDVGITNDPVAKTTTGTVYITLTPPAGEAIAVSSGYTVRYHEQDGSTVNVTISGGQVQLFFAGQDISFSIGKRNIIEVMGVGAQLYDVYLTKSSLRTSISVTAKGGDNLADIGSIRGESVLGRFNGRYVNLTGAGVEMTGDGYIRTLVLNNITGGADILMAGAGAGMTMSLGAIETGTEIGLYSDKDGDGEIDIDECNNLSSFSAASWVDGIFTANNVGTFSAVSWTGGTFTANSVGTFRITGSKTQIGNLTNTDLRLAPNGGKGAGTIRVAGAITGGTWIVGVLESAPGDPIVVRHEDGLSIGSILAGSMTGVDMYTGGGVGSIQTGLWQAGSLNANWLQTLKIVGDKRNINSGTLSADITLNGNLRGYSLVSVYVSNKILGGTWNLKSSMKTLQTIAGSQNAWTVDITKGNIGSITSGGTFGGKIEIHDGTLGTLKALGIYTADLKVTGADAKGVSINKFQVGRSTAGNLTASHGVNSISAGEWLAGQIEAAYINSLQASGRGMSGDMTPVSITLNGKNAKNKALGIARIAGDFDINSIRYGLGIGAGDLGPIYQHGKRIN